LDVVRSSPNALIRVAFALFVASIPFETVLGLDELSLSRIAGTAFFALAFVLQPGVSFRRPHPAYWCFATFAVVYFAGAALRGIYRPLGWFTLLQLFVLLWVASNLLRYEKVFLTTLYMFVAACVAISLLFLSGRLSVDVGGAGRVTAVDQDPNTFGSMLALGLLTVLCIGYGRGHATEGRAARAISWVCLLVIALGVVKTGSRGATVALAAGMSVLVLRKGSSWLKLRNAVVAVSALAVLVILVSSFEVTRRRWELVFERGSMSGRERIFPYAVQMFRERPLTGWGPGLNVQELGVRLGVERKDTHNVYLWVLTEDGLIGGIPYLVGIALCIRAAWRGRRLSYGLVPLSLLVAVLIVNMDVTWQFRKLYWLVLALALASEQPFVPASRRGTAVRARLKSPVPRRLP
jgi:O-antigen ligase